MRTRTIFEAYQEAVRRYRSGIGPNSLRVKHLHRMDSFERELLRRMDERDALVAWRPRCTTIADLEAFGRSTSVSVKTDASGGGK